MINWIRSTQPKPHALFTTRGAALQNTRWHLMTLLRVLEPEVMDSEQEAADYDAIDNQEVNDRFCADLLAVAPTPRRVLDVGTGTALLPIALCRRSSLVQVVAIDMAQAMLAAAQVNVMKAGLSARISLARRDAKSTGYAAGSFDVVMCNSIIHHIPEPLAALAEMLRLVEPGGVLFVRDLLRPASAAELQALVDRYAPVPEAGPAAQQAMQRRQRDLFAASLRAALTLQEVGELASLLGASSTEVRMTSDRHFTLIAHAR